MNLFCPTLSKTSIETLQPTPTNSNLHLHLPNLTCEGIQVVRDVTPWYIEVTIRNVGEAGSGRSCNVLAVFSPTSAPLSPPPPPNLPLPPAQNAFPRAWFMSCTRSRNTSRCEDQSN